MGKDYRYTKTTVSLINYHFVFCPRYRRKIFNDSEVDARFKELVHKECKRNEWKVLAIETDEDHCHLFVNVQPTYSPSDVMRIIKGATSRKIRYEFELMNKKIGRAPWSEWVS